MAPIRAGANGGDGGSYGETRHTGRHRQAQVRHWRTVTLTAQGSTHIYKHKGPHYVQRSSVAHPANRAIAPVECHAHVKGPHWISTDASSGGYWYGSTQEPTLTATINAHTHTQAQAGQRCISR